MAETTNPVTGFKDLVYCVMTGGDTSSSVAPVYGPVKSLFKTSQFGVDPAASQVVGYYDDQAAYAWYSEGEKSLTIAGDRLTAAVRAEVYGMTYANGIVSDSSSDNPPYLAIGGKFTRGDGTSDYFWLPKVQLAKSAISADTKAATIAPQNENITGKVLNLAYNGEWRLQVNTADAIVPAGTLTSWFTAPVISTAAAFGAITVAAAAGTAGQIVFTFTKAGGNTTINPASLTNGNITISIDSSGAIVTPTTWTWGTAGGATQTLTAAGLTAVKHDYVVTSAIKDINQVACTPKAGSVTVS